MNEKTTEMLVLPRCIHPYNAQHIGKREEQQDYFSYSDIYDRDEFKKLGAVAVLADGMGGLNNGREAAKTAVLTFMESYKSSDIENIKERMIYAAEIANDAAKCFDGAGSTLCAVVVKDWKLYWLSIGDSRIYLYRNKSIRQLNYEHNYGNYLDRKALNGEIGKTEARNDKMREALTSYLGIDVLDEIDVNVNDFKLFKGDSVLLCSDGLYRTLSDEEIAKILTDGQIDVCDVLVETAFAKNNSNQDNITVALMDLD